MEEGVTRVMGFLLHDFVDALRDFAGQRLTSELFATHLLTALNSCRGKLARSAGEVLESKIPDLIRELVPDKELCASVLSLVIT